MLVSAGDPNMTLSRLKATSAVHRLISPSEMGELFKVLAFGKGIDGPLLGFQSARPMALKRSSDEGFLQTETGDVKTWRVIARVCEIPSTV